MSTNLEDDAEPLRVRVPPGHGLRRESDLLIDQLRAIDNLRLLDGPLTRLNSDKMRRIDEAIREVLDLIP